jgi:hypothetical protein
MILPLSATLNSATAEQPVTFRAGCCCFDAERMMA